MGEETILATVPVFPPRSRSPVLRRGEKYLISIACDEVHLHWCIHGSIETDLSPVVLWRTGHIPAAAGGGSLRERIVTLSAHLPTRAHEYVFGSTEIPRCDTRSTSRSSSRSRSSSSSKNKKSLSWYEAMAASISRPDLHVCVVSDIPEQTALLQHLWSAVPSVLPTGLGCTDFFTCEQAGPGRDVGGMRVHRLAMLRGAAEMYDFPALVLDCGGAGGACPSRTTYTASDGWGRIIGGGAGPGLRSSPASRLSPDSEARRDLLVDDDLLDRAVDRAIRIYSKGGVAVAGGDDDDPESSSSGGKEDKIALVMIQLAMSVREVVDRWLTSLDGAEDSRLGVQSGRDGPSSLDRTADADTCTAVGEADERVVPLEAAGGPNGGGSAEPCSPSPKGDDDRPMRYVVFTGVDGERMWRLCQLNYSSNGVGVGGGGKEDVDPFAKRRVLFRYQNNLVHYGTAAVLMKILQCGRWTASEWRDSVRNRMEDDPVSYLGLRVARRFRMVSDDGGCDEEDSDFEEDDSIFRGSVVGIREEPATKGPRSKVKYVIKYDDEDREIVAKRELLKMIELYRDVGERSRRESNDKRGDGRRRTRGAPGKPAGGRRKKGKRSRTLPDGEVYVNRRVAKVFESEIFFGIVTSYLPPDDESQSPYWHVEYDDGDEEDFDPKDLKASFKLYECAKVLDNDDGDGF